MQYSPLLLLLDVMMPKKDGFEVCREIRKSSNVPIIMITAKSEDADRIMGLENALEVFIQDQGYGISEEELPDVWDLFYKADKSRKSSGTGLGLAIAKHLVQLHGGNVSLQSSVGKGTTIIIKLPIEIEYPILG